MLTAVLAPPAMLTVTALVLNNDAVPALDVTILGLAPFMFNVVPLVIVKVGFPTVNVPVAAPILNAVAAPPKLIVVGVALNSVNVELGFSIVAFFRFIVPVAAPMLTLVAAPAKLIVVATVLNKFCAT